MSANIEVAPIAGALGAEVSGVNLGQLNDAAFAAVRDAFHEHQVLFFRDQEMAPEQHKAFGKRFGSLNIHPYVKGMEGHEEIMEITKEPEDTLNFGGGWHSDMSFLEEPCLGSVLYAKEVPPFGGDTLFANQYLAYETLSSGMQKMLDGMTAIHSAEREYSTYGHSAQKRSSMSVEQAGDNVPQYEHPVVRTHPETGRKALFINGAFTIKFKDMTRKESLPLIKFLIGHATREPLTCRFRWEKNSVAFWDNRCVQHYALNDYQGHRRRMQRVTINGDRPF